MSTSKSLVVIGGGAAGFFCAVNAARLQPGLKVTIVEKSNKLLSKVRISGGGRCNVTHACWDITEMSKRYPRGGNFVKKTFHQFFTKDTVSWFGERGVNTKEEEDGRMFPESNSSQSIIDCIMRESNRYGVEVLMNTEVKGVKNEDGKWLINSVNQHLTSADYVCIASGGYPKASMFEWIRLLGHHVEEPVPSLFSFNLASHPIKQLMGISVENARVKIIGTKLEQEGPLLITHWGLSGPAILKLSAWGARDLAKLNYDFRIAVNWLPAINEQELAVQFSVFRFDMATQKIINKNPFSLPQRLWALLIDESGIDAEKRWADLSAKEQNKLINNLCGSVFGVKGKTTFKEEFVTAGGVVLKEINPSTMESKLVPGLFFAGEIMDVDGITGGYNFQHAWTSGFIAAKTIADLSASE